ncbi:LysE family translocator [Endozoicomonas sp. 8E]|uniref:LysE family translocator n=2 Tax=unclassified Endozoicomonas TaxID=2644528 RepID=UPI002938F42D|nr:LysE family translocator [Endozoicomonas sp. 8E]WOG27396.1 LysE family translocator [Endozoicomonas sp. 8E]
MLLFFFLAVSVMVITPGPNGALIIKTVSKYGKLHGYHNVLGIVAAFFIHGTLSIFGLSAIILTSTGIFNAIKTIGAIYLAYLAIKAFMSSIKYRELKSDGYNIEKGRCLYRRKYILSLTEGLLTNTLNPKVSLFYISVFPQFSGYYGSNIATLYSLVTIHAIFAFLWFSLMTIFVSKSISFTNSQTSNFVIQFSVGCILSVFSYKVLILGV